MHQLTIHLSDTHYLALQEASVERGMTLEQLIAERLECHAPLRESERVPDTPIKMGDALAAIGRDIGLSAKDCAIFEHIRDKTPAQPMEFQ